MNLKNANLCGVFFWFIFVYMAAGVQHIGRKRNLLKRYKAIMDEFNKHDCRYIPISVIYREFIYPKFHISRDTLYRVLNTPIEEELKALEEKRSTHFH